MQKYSFLDDYSEGCHPNILKALVDTNSVQQTAYGFDEYSLNAKSLIKSRLDNKQSEVFFISGGTQANLTITSSFLQSHEAIISVDIGHIIGREAGAIEATGHKVISVKTEDGKLTSSNIEEVLESHNAVPHMVKPKLVYISNATEIGAVYTKAELEELHECCLQNNLYLFVDGARLASALCSKKSDLKLEDLAKLTDVFTIGGTKNGALLGEAIVINQPVIAKYFNIHIKQRGGLLAKGRILGIQFYELFKENLYFELAQHANDMAEKIAKAFQNKGYELTAEIQSNQIFLILPNVIIEELQKKFSFYVWAKYDDENSVVRIVTSWATEEIKVDALIESIQ